MSEMKKQRASTFEYDLEKENIMHAFMRLHYYQRKLADKSITGFQRATTKDRQLSGEDISFNRDGIRFIVDEKAQMDFIEDKAPLPTFVLELLYMKNGEIRPGWFVRDDLRTTHYMFIWPHADEDLKSVDNIEYAHYALVEKNTLREKILEKWNLGSDQLFELAIDLKNNPRGEKKFSKKNKNQLVGYRYKEVPFNDQGYLYYTVFKREKPINFIVQRVFLEEIAVEKGTLRRPKTA